MKHKANQLREFSYRRKGRLLAPENLLSTNKEHPIFSFQYLEEEFDSHRKLTDSNWARAFHDIFKLSKLTWEEIQKIDHRKNGCEVIHTSSLKIKPRIKLSEEVKLLSFRVSGQEGRMIGFREDDVFFVLFFDFHPFIIYRH